MGVVVLLTQALQDPVKSVRQAAVAAIGVIEPGSQLLEPVVGLLRSPDATIEERQCGHCYEPTQANGFLPSSQQGVTPMQRFVRGSWRWWVSGEGRRPPLGSESGW